MSKTVLALLLLAISPTLCAGDSDIRDRYGNLLGTKSYDRSTREYQYRDRTGSLDFTKQRNDNGYDVRDRDGKYIGSEQRRR